MSDITISYKGSSIATMDATGTKTLLTEGKYCEDDITVDYVKSGGDIAYWGDEGCLYYKDMVIPSTNVTTSYYLCEYLETIYAPNATSFNNNAGGSNCLNLKSVHYPKCSTFGNYFIRQQGSSYNKLESIIIGSIGNPVTKLTNNWRYGSHAMTLTVTIYVNANTIADIPSDITSYAAGNNVFAPSGSTVTIIYKNSTTGEVITA